MKAIRTFLAKQRERALSNRAPLAGSPVDVKVIPSDQAVRYLTTVMPVGAEYAFVVRAKSLQRTVSRAAAAVLPVLTFLKFKLLGLASRMLFVRRSGNSLLTYLTRDDYLSDWLAETDRQSWERGIVGICWDGRKRSHSLCLIWDNDDVSTVVYVIAEKGAEPWYEKALRELWQQKKLTAVGARCIPLTAFPNVKEGGSHE